MYKGPISYNKENTNFAPLPSKIFSSWNQYKKINMSELINTKMEALDIIVALTRAISLMTPLLVLP